MSEAIPSLPYSEEAEKGVLSCFLQGPHLLDSFAETNSAEEFYHPSHRLVYDVMCELHGTGKPVDLVSLSHHLDDKKLFEKVGGPGTLAELYSFVPTAAHYPYYTGIMHDKHLLRRIIAGCTESIQNAYEYQEDVPLLLDRVEQRILAVRDRDTREPKSEHIKHTILDTVDAIEERVKNKGEMTGHSTGFTWLDKITGGIRPETWFIGARPSVGKTSMALQLIIEICVNQRVPTGFFSLEMSRQRVEMRLISMISDVPLERVRSGQFQGGDKQKFYDAVLLLQKSPLLIDDRSGLTLSQVAAKTRRWQREHGVKAIFGDYLQRMGHENRRKAANMAEMHSENVTGITNMAKDAGLINIWLAQLNRECEKRPGGKPLLVDFEGCGRIEQDADFAMMMSRPRDQPQSDDIQHILFDVQKQRDGDTREKLHLFTRATTTFRKHPIADEDQIPKQEPQTQPKGKRSWQARHQ